MFYAIMKRLLFFLPKRWNNKDVQGAVGAAAALALIIAGVLKYAPKLGAALLTVLGLSACSTFQLNAEYEHHSSIPMVNDLNTTDQVGLCGEWALGTQKYAPMMELCMHKELDESKPVFGDDPVGTIRLKQPLWKFQR